MEICSVSINKQLSNNTQYRTPKEKPRFFPSFGNFSPALDISALYNFSFTGAKGSPVYAISNDGKYQKFNSQTEAANALNISLPAICNCLAGRHNIAGGMSFLRAKDVEIQNEDGSTEIDIKKIKERVEYLNYTSVYLINQDGSYKKYGSQTEAANEIGVLPSSLSKCSKGAFKIGNVCAVRALDFEVENEDGTTGIKRDVLEKCVEELGYTTVYLIKQDGSCEKYNSQTEAARQIGVTASALYNAMGKYKIKGMAVKRGCDIERLDENGRVYPDEDKIEEITQTFKNECTRPTYVIDKGGTYKKFPSQAQAADEFNFTSEKIFRCLSGKCKMPEGKYIIRASDLEKMHENGTYEIDEEKFKKILELIN